MDCKFGDIIVQFNYKDNVYVEQFLKKEYELIRVNNENGNADI